MSYGFERLDSNPPPPLLLLRLVVIKYDNANKKIMNHAYSSYLSCLRRGPRLDCLLTTVVLTMIILCLPLCATDVFLGYYFLHKYKMTMFELIQWRFSGWRVDSARTTQGSAQTWSFYIFIYVENNNLRRHRYLRTQG